MWFSPQLLASAREFVISGLTSSDITDVVDIPLAVLSSYFRPLSSCLLHIPLKCMSSKIQLRSLGECCKFP